jgi:cytochrome c-type biogenesis protein CcmH
MKVLILIFCLFNSSVFAASETLYPFTSIRQEAQFNSLLKELRCLVCQNQDLFDSNASLAQDLRKEVYVLVQNNQSDAEIVQYLTARYGDFILFKPPLKSLTILLWCGPIVFLVLGLFVFWFTCIKRR